LKMIKKVVCLIPIKFQAVQKKKSVL